MLVKERFINEGVQEIHRFENGYGASVVKTPWTISGRAGKWELAVLKFTGEDWNDFDLDYSTDVTGDVCTMLDDLDKEYMLKKIESLKGDGTL